MTKATVKILGKAVDTQRVPALMGADLGNADDDGSGAWSVEELATSETLMRSLWWFSLIHD
jgi:hypothetical protein